MQQLLRLLPFVRPYRLGIAAGLLCVVAANAAGVAVPWLVGRAIDTLAQPDAALRTFVHYAAAIVLATALAGAARFAMRLLLNGYSRRIETDLRDAFLDQLLRLDAAFYGATRTGDLMSRATNDTQAVRMAIGPGIMYLVNTLVTSVFVLAMMFYYSPRLTLVSIVPLLLLAPVMQYFGRVIHRRFERIQEHYGVLSTMVQENLSGVRIVRAYTGEAAQEQEFDALSAEYLERNMALARTSAVFQPLLTLLTGLGTLAILGYGGLEVMAGRMSAGDFVAFLFYLGMLAWPMMALGWVINLFQRGAASMGRIARILDTPPAIADPASPARIAIRGGIEFRGVGFRYPGTERDVLRDVSFRIEPGETVALVGPTGAGKSTILALLARRYDPTDGEILIDGTALRDIPLATLRGALGIVPQDAFVFSDTIAANLAFGLPPSGDGADTAAGVSADGRPDPRIERAARVARLADTITAFPHGYGTRLGERGVTLSGGQRQRATLARALARDPRILVLDDALSAVDTHTEKAILDGLRYELDARTALIVSHRVSAVMDAEQILVLDDGRIVERGRHDELVARGGLYATLLHRQLLAEHLDDAVAAPHAEV
jgi:ATP-binding cassette subfamily B multidrug efflux pump